MNKFLKYSLLGVGGLIVLTLAAAAFIAATFNPNDYKPLVVKLVKDKKQRTLNIEGDIKLAFWPKIGADLGKVSISEHNGDKEFAGIHSAKVFLAVMPLLKKELVIDTVIVDGVTANIVRHKDGTTNFDDLLSKDDQPSQEIKFDIDGIQVTNSTVSLDDEMGGRHFIVDQANIKTGHVAKNQPITLDLKFHVKGDQPVIDANLQFKGTLLADTENKQYGAKGMVLAMQGGMATAKNIDLTLSGDLEAKPETSELLLDGIKLAAKANLDGKPLALELSAPNLTVKKDEINGKKISLAISKGQGDDVLTAKFAIDDIKGTPKSFQSTGIAGEISGKQGARTIAGKFSSPISGNLETQVFELQKLAGSMDIKDPALPNGAAKVDFNLNARADLKQKLAAAGLDVDIDGSRVKGKLDVAGFDKPNVKFDLTADQLDLNKLLGKPEATAKPAPSKPADLSALKNVLAQGSVKIGSISYQQYHITNLAVTIKADGQKVSVAPFSAKVDESTINASLGVSHFENPVFSFNVDIDKLDADRYVTKSEPSAKSSSDTPLDLTPLKTINASGDAKIGWLKLANVKTSNVKVSLKAADGQIALAPFSADLYQGSMAGSLNVDARTTPAIAFKQDMKNINIGPLLVDAIKNDMLEGKGILSVDVRTQGATVGALKKALNGNAAVKLADGAVKGIDIAGTINDIKGKFNFKGNTLGADQKKRTDFSEMTASFKITNGVAHNDDLSMKTPLLRIAGSGDIDIGNETIKYTAKPTVVASLKGQGGSDISALNGLTFPVNVTGTFADPKYGLDFSGIGAAIAQKSLLGSVGGSKGDALGKVLGGGDKTDALGGLLGNKSAPKTQPDQASPAPTATPNAAQPEPVKKKKLNQLLGL